MLTVVCWKWQPRPEDKHYGKRSGFGAGHVNRLRAMVERNLTLPHEFVCVTDNAKGLHSAVRAVDIDRNFGDYARLGGCYRRLKAFDMAAGLMCFGDRFLCIDLDVVVTGSLDHIAWFGEDFRIWEDQYRRSTPYCGSLWGMRAGAREVVWGEFNRHPELSIGRTRERRYTGTDQAVISEMLYPGEAVWGEGHGVYNFNTRVRICSNGVERVGGEWRETFKRDGGLPKGARLVFFNGKYDPSQPELQRRYPWVGDLWRE